MPSTYEDIGLNNYLQPITAPISTQGGISAYEFDSLNQRGVVTNSFLQDGVITTVKIGSAAVTDAKILTLDAGKLTAGTIEVAINLGTPGTGSIKLDGANNRIVINDGTVDRIYLGEF